MRFLKSDERGATAIEYAIIAGLIGLGLVGSLVTTRGSLRAVFGTASSQMASAAATAPTAPVQTGPALVFNPNNTRSPFWQAKTVASGPTVTSTANNQTIDVRFSDGSRVSFRRSLTGGSGSYLYEDPSTRTQISGLTDASNNLTFLSLTTYTDSSLSNTQGQVFGNISGNVLQNQTTTTCVQSGGCPGSTGAPTAAFQSTVNDTLKDIALWAANLQVQSAP